MKIIQNGICAPVGFKCSGVHCGIRKNKSKKDLALIISEKKGSSAAVYTTNLVKGAPITVTQNNLKNLEAQAVIVNSGNANTCNSNGIEIAEKMCALVESYCNINRNDVIVASTGVIGQPLNIEPIEAGFPKLIKNLGNNSVDASEAIMTTDTVKKEIAVSFKIGEVECRIGGIAKGSGMINPNMATLLVFLTSDINITPKLLHKAISEDVKNTFNMLSVDGDTSTNDMLSIIANGMAGNVLINQENNYYYEFIKALNFVTSYLCKCIAADGEGATKLIICEVRNALDENNAKLIAKSVIKSSLVKAAMFGEDANWGRVLCAIGYSKADVDVNKIDVDFLSQQGSISVCKKGAGIDFPEVLAKKILGEKEIKVIIDCNQNNGAATAWGCDLTYDYVKINGDYRT